MSNRQKIYIGVAVSAGVCTGIGLYLYYRYQRQTELSRRNRPLTPTSILSSLKSHQDHQYNDVHSSSEIDNDDSESLQSPSDIPIPGGGVPLTPDQATILTRFLYESNDDEEQLHRVLTSIANASTFKESQINLANAGCITHLRKLLLSTDNETTKCKIFLALNNLALNDFAITEFSDIVSIVINLCRISQSNSLVRLYGLNLLINMSVLEYLHDEYMSSLYELSALIESTFEYDDEVLSAGKILVNLSTNKINLEDLLKITSLDLKTIVNFFTSKKDSSSKYEDILLRYLTFYCNLADAIINEFKRGGDTNNNNLWLYDPTPQRQGALYFEFFDHDKQILAKSLLRPQHVSNTINTQMKRLYQAMDKIRQNQIELSVLSMQNEFNENDSSVSTQSTLITNNNENYVDNFLVENNTTIATKS